MKRFLTVTTVLVACSCLVPAVVSAKPRLDRTFGVGGIQTYYDLDEPQDLTEDAKGRLYALTTGTKDRAQITRILADGRKDASFGQKGTVDTGKFVDVGKFGVGEAIQVTKGGNVYVAGPESPGRSSAPICGALERFRTTGKLDIGFADRGIKRQCLKKGKRTKGFSPQSVDITGQGKVLVAGRTIYGRSDTAIAVARFNRNGSLDRSFRGGPGTRSGQPGILEYRHRAQDFGTAQEVLALRKGKVLVAARQGSVPVFIKLNADGSLDRSFGKNGAFTLNLPGYGPCGCYDRIDVDIDSKGRIVLMTYLWMPGGPSHGMVVIRLNKDGKVDRSFGKNGWARPYPRKAFYPDAMTVQNDDRIVVLGDYRGDEGGGGSYGIFRLREDGRLDRSFFNRGLFRPGGHYLEAAGSGTDRTLLIDRKGRIVASSGWFGSPVSLLRIIPD